MNMLAAACLCWSAVSAAPDVAVVCPTELVAPLQPWLAHRRAQGHEIALLSNLGAAADVRGRIREVARQGNLRAIVLIGDVATEDGKEARCTPTYLAPARVNVRWGSEPEIATDNWFADLDDDQLPDVAIGRLTADSAEELAAIVRKVLAYEQQLDFRTWRRQVNFVAGVGGLGNWTDAIVETVTKKLIADGIPPAYGTTMTYASWRSPFCPDPRAFASVTRGRLNEGCLFWVYLGHGHRQTLDVLQTPGEQHRIFDVRDVPQLTCQNGLPVALFLACYTGAFDGPRDCLAEELLRAPQAPVAVFAGSRVTMPYAMAVLGLGLLDQCFAQRPATLGEAILNAKRQMAAAPPNEGNRVVLDLLASAMSPAPKELAAERLEHVQLFNLLGDPLLRIKHPQSIAVQAPPNAAPGEVLKITARAPIAGRCTVELVARRDRLTFHPPQRAEYDRQPETLAGMQEVYRRANDPRYASTQLAVEPGEFQVALPAPATALGACHVRVYVEGADAFALGAADIELRAPDRSE